MKRITNKLILIEFFFFFSCVLSQNINISPSNQAYKNEPVNDNEPNIIKGWLKFFTFVPDFLTNDMPTKFDYNPAYREQFSHDRNPEFNIKDTDEFGFFNIPTETSFFFCYDPKNIICDQCSKSKFSEKIVKF